jgi:molybdenum cofactor cytidylyltransferase
MGESHLSRIVGVLLAAGGSVRLGKPKQLLPFGGRTLVEHALDILHRSPLDEVIVVLGAHADEIAPLMQHPRVRVVPNPDWEQGQSASLRAAVDAVSDDCEAVIFLPCDMPWITPELIGGLIRAWRESGKPMIAAASSGKLSVPALFAREMFAELQRLSGDRGGRGLFEKHPERVAAVPVPADVLADIDTPEEYERAIQRLRRQKTSANCANERE